MKVRVYLITGPDEPREYVQTHRPTPERMRVLAERGCRVHTYELVVPSDHDAIDCGVVTGCQVDLHSEVP